MPVSEIVLYVYVLYYVIITVTDTVFKNMLTTVHYFFLYVYQAAYTLSEALSEVNINIALVELLSYFAFKLIQLPYNLNLLSFFCFFTTYVFYFFQFVLLLLT